MRSIIRRHIFYSDASRYSLVAQLVGRGKYDGLPKTRVQHILTAVAITLARIDAVLTGTPRGNTRVSPFARLRSPANLPEALGT